MSDLKEIFLKLYLDEDVSPVIGRILRGHGFDAIATSEIRLLASSDKKQLQYASSHKRTLVTHNKVDFLMLHKQYLSEGKRHCGIILTARRRDNYEVARRLLKFLNTVMPQEMDNQIRFV